MLGFIYMNRASQLVLTNTMESALVVTWVASPDFGAFTIPVCWQPPSQPHGALADIASRNSLALMLLSGLVRGFHRLGALHRHGLGMG